MDIVSRRIVHTAIITVWVVTMALLLFRHYGPHQGTDAEYRSAHLPEELFEEQRMGAYHGKEKIGYSRWQMEKTPEGYLISEMLVMRLGVMGEKKDIDTNITARLNSDLRLHSFELVLRADTITRISGKVEDTNLHVLRGHAKDLVPDLLANH